MASGAKILNVLRQDEEILRTLTVELSITEIMARLLVNRGIKTPAAAESFLSPALNTMCDPFMMPGMDRAVELIRNAASKRQKAMIFGDYDVDGVTSVGVLEPRLAAMGLEVSSVLPHRLNEGYGLNQKAVRRACDSGVELFITVDCGINSREEVEILRRQGIEVIITDHHEPDEGALPGASVLLNPKIKDSVYPFRELAGVGVAYKLCQALSPAGIEEDLDLVCLGTIADVVPLNGENRVMVKHGLERLGRTNRAGLKALMKSSGLSGKKLSSHSVAFVIGPRINAGGRMGKAEVSLSLLSCSDDSEAETLAREIENFNRSRQKIESSIMEDARALIETEVNFKEHNVIVIAKDGWHQGVLGIVAAKLSDYFHRPAILISMQDHLCRGSGRSIKNFHLFSALCRCGEFLEEFGGHSHAVGLSINRSNISDFRDKINQFARQALSREDLIPAMEADMELPLASVNAALVNDIRRLEPFGAGNPEPLFVSRGLKVKGNPRLLKKDTIKFWVTDGKATLSAIGFGMGGILDSLSNADCFDLVYRPEIDEWYGDDSVILHIKEIFFH